jgi:hypothetical protein
MMTNRLGMFTLCILFFAGLVIAANSAVKSLAVGDMRDMPAIAAATDLQSRHAMPDVDIAVSQLFAGLEPQVSVTDSGLPASRLAERLHAVYSDRLAGWKQRRASWRWSPSGVTVDNLTQVFRLSLGPWQAVGVSREPAGFHEAGFEKQLLSAGATDMMSVAVITPMPTGSRLTTYRIDGRKLASLRMPTIQLPPCLRVLDGQSELVSVPFEEAGHSGLKVFRTSSLPLRAGWERRRAALAASGASVEIVLDVAGAKTMQVTGDGWVAIIAFSASDESMNMTETVEFLLADNKGTTRP